MSRRLSPPADEHGIIGAAPRRDELAGLPMFLEAVTPTEAAAEIRRDFLAPPSSSPASSPAPAEREAEQTGAFDAIAPADRLAGIERIKRELHEPLLELAARRKDQPESPGVTAKDVRELADARGLTSLVGPQQRAWSWLPTWLATLCRHQHLVKYRVAGMVVKRIETSGNEHVVYLHPYDFRARTAA